MAKMHGAVEAILAQHPDLTMKGFGGLSEKDGTPEQSRAEMLTDGALAQFDRACGWLAKLEKSATVNMDAGTSFGLKHAAERYWRRQPRKDPAAKGADSFIAEGMFICAAIHLGFAMTREVGSPSVCINIAKRSLKGLEEVKPRRPKRHG